MAFLYKTDNSPNWIAGFRDINSKRRNRSTGIQNNERNRRKAQRIADEFESIARNRRASQQVRRSMSELHQEVTGQEIPTVTLRSHVEAWLKSKEPSVAQSSMATYQSTTTKFMSYLGNKSDSELIDITREDIEGFRDSLVQKVAPKTVNNNIKALRMLFRDARDRGVLVDDPTEFVKPVKIQKNVKRRAFTLDEIKNVLSHCNKEWYSMVFFALYTGQRLGDIARIQWSQIDLNRESITITTTKTGQIVHFPLHSSLLKHLGSLPAPTASNQYLHPRAAQILETQGRTGTLSRQFGEILAEAGLREKKTHRKAEKGKGRAALRKVEALTFHSLRRTATSMLHEAEVPQSVAMALIGHDSKEIHQVYVDVGEKAIRQAASKLPAL